jgi:hypothetical protein
MFVSGKQFSQQYRNGFAVFIGFYGVWDTRKVTAVMGYRRSRRFL